jgi:hypothetical protein
MQHVNLLSLPDQLEKVKVRTPSLSASPQLFWPCQIKVRTSGNGILRN